MTRRKFLGTTAITALGPTLAFAQTGLRQKVAPLRELMSGHIAQGYLPGFVSLVAKGTAAAMMLVEEGKFTLDEPVDRLLPELANRRVLKHLDGPIDDSVPATREITIRDLMQFTMGFGLLFNKELPIQKAIDGLQLANGQP